MVRQREQYDTLRYFMLTLLAWSSQRRMLKHVPDVVRICPYLNLMFPVNKYLSLEVPLGLSALL